MNELSHVDKSGKARMVDVSGKKDQLRIAVARGFIRLNPETVRLIREKPGEEGRCADCCPDCGYPGREKDQRTDPPMPSASYH